MAEGARLESVYTVNRIGGSNPSLSASPFILLHLEAVCATMSASIAGGGTWQNHQQFT